jgi:hypothetical protein
MNPAARLAAASLIGFGLLILAAVLAGYGV